MRKLIAFLGLVIALVAIFAINGNDPNTKKNCDLRLNVVGLNSDKIKNEVAVLAPMAPEAEIVAERSVVEPQPATDENQSNILELTQELTSAHEEIEALKKENDFLKHELTKLHKKSLVDHQAWNCLQDPEGEMDLDHLQKMAMNLFETLPEINPHDLSPSQLNDLVVGFAKLRNCEELARSAFCGMSFEKLEENQQGIGDILKREKEEDERFRNCLANQFGSEVATNWNH